MFVLKLGYVVIFHVKLNLKIIRANSGYIIQNFRHVFIIAIVVASDKIATIEKAIIAASCLYPLLLFSERGVKRWHLH